jgi:hypothetical protein
MTPDTPKPRTGEPEICPDCNHPWSRHMYGFGSCEDCTRAGACKPTPPVGETGPPKPMIDLETFEDRAYQRGAEAGARDMRERAAHVADVLSKPSIAEAIRALPLTAEKERHDPDCASRRPDDAAYWRPGRCDCGPKLVPAPPEKGEADAE